MLTYFAIVHKDKDSAFGISFPDLPGCFSASDSEADIYANAHVALSLYLQDAGDVAAPRSIEALRQDRGIKADLARGAYLIAVPVVFSSSKQRYNLMLDRAQVESIDVVASRVGVSRSEFVARAIDMRMSLEIGAAVIERRRAMTNRSARDKTSGKNAKSVAASALTQKTKAKAAAPAKKAPAKKK